MSSALLTADWFLLGRDVYFRKFEIYSMSWTNEVNLDNYTVCAAQYGGPIAVKRDSSKFVKETGQPIISIFTSSGKNISSFKWTKKPILHMGWSNEEKLLIIQEDGYLAIHDIFGKFLHAFSLIQKMNDTKLLDAILFTNPQNFTGVVVMTSNFKVFLINNIEEPRTRQLSELPRGVKPTCWTIISADSQTDVLVASEKDLYRLRQDEHYTTTALQPEITNAHTSILACAVSFNARHIALFTDSGYLWLGSSSFRSKYCEVDTSVIHKPKQLVWCGNEAVVAYWDMHSTILVVGIHGQKMSYIYDSPVHIVQEIDGVRIISNMQHELLQKVPHVVQKIFRINSTEPGSFLLEASKQFQKGSHRANEYILLVKDNLQTAVDQCIDAVGYEFDTEVQKKLIRAAQFGKCFIPNSNSDKYVNMCRLLRVLNDIRKPKIGIPLTLSQLTYLSNKVLLDRLITRKEYYLAIEIAKYLKLPDPDGRNHILVHWAKYKVSQSHLEEETVARIVAEKLGRTPGISYSEVANAAAENGRKKIAIKLLDYEPRASEQIQLLLQLEENHPALQKAIESGDTDLVYMVILKLREKMPLADFKMMIRSFPIAQSLYIKYCKKHNTQALTEIYIQEDDFCSQAETFIAEALDENKSHMQDANLTSAAEAYRKGRKDLYTQMCDEALRLVRVQRELEEKLNMKNKLRGKSVHETCEILLETKDPKIYEKFKNDFKIPDKRFSWMRIQSLAKSGDWIELEKFSKLKKSSTTYTPFVEACIQYDKKDEVMKYLPKLSEDIKVKYYIKAGFLEEAAKIAFSQRDVQNLYFLQSKCNRLPHLVETINGMLNQLEPRK